MTASRTRTPPGPASGAPPDLAGAATALAHMRVCGLVLIASVVAIVVFIVLARMPGAGIVLPPWTAMALVFGLVGIWVIAPLWFVVASIRFARAAGESVVMVGGLTFLLAPLSFPFTYAHARHILAKLGR